MYQELLHDSSASRTAEEAIIDERIALAFLDLDDNGIVMDLRQVNGSPNSWPSARIQSFRGQSNSFNCLWFFNLRRLDSVLQRSAAHLLLLPKNATGKRPLAFMKPRRL